MKFNHNVLFVSSSGLKEDSPAKQALTSLQKAIAERGFVAQIADNIHHGIKYIKESPKYSAIGIFWDNNNPKMNIEAEGFISLFRQRNSDTPILLISEENITDNVSINILKEVSEYIYLYSETATFTANRIYTLIHRYAESLLPPYFKTLKNFTEDGDYYWDCPGHMGGMAYLKHPIGIEFINFFGENMMRADIGVATAEMGDYLIHAGPSKTSEEIAAELFGADWTFYGVSGSSGSNRIVAQGAVGANEIVVVDRNCHKSLNHGLTLSQGRPVYLKPTRNGYGLIGPIPTKRLSQASISQLIKESPLAEGAVSTEPTYAVVTNCTYDGFCYNVNDVVKNLAVSVPRIHFDEAWYAYARFHPLYKNRFAMDVAEDMPNRPTIFAVQSTHKMLPSLSMASMIHVKKSDRAPLNFDDFNDSFMMHGTTSPYYPIIASIDVAVGMMKGESGLSLVQESIEEAIGFRKAVVSVKRQLKEQNGESEWFFDVLQPTQVRDPKTGESHSFEQAPLDLLSQESDCWTLKAGDKWHGFSDEDIADSDSMLDPVKVTITCPGITADGQYQKMGIPGYIITKFLDDRRIEIARTGDYTILILFSVGVTKGKWGTLLESLLTFKKLYDSNALATEAIPSLKEASPKYAKMTLKQLCQTMHNKMDELDLMKHISEAVNTDPTPVMSPADAYQKVVRYKAEHIPLDDFSGRISATMLVPYPPGIPVLMPGERLPKGDQGIIGYLKALQNFDKEFPGFEHEIQGINVDENGDFWVRAIVEDEREAKVLPSHIKFKRHVSAIKKGRQ
ncbi:Orn/Lys/Arg decarboxylase N-terminal domain-containing protein [Proteus faecis]|uniref:Orn/Lys/Arg decarboxylase N-terminal domain-containing protein n=1 Tax=Proteus faecis TaxID=2050967 RepID=A0AAW7CMW0_9GAMM|nr:Orn/Lys/Arg decarboxylase N-terminal domain-containing protein [Proteus faecis]MDL5167449.1 Orn/Lys/Arg decarboxylase N-terminal domain-containing protein [Proteus faecis]MDL5275432.1 Orn/Lys/Arg decarboxylase N-terminal domain-containing protein [Proteus faecis]MDL5279001.1 Orn/Lys/Arg decarboxylase N-terminal domain-containing protein [Proteus faecis]MDL5307879.1 Orn/Lys/Arg decarboxylase N-terminal domain-containing protein [Proteus faecis]MDL5311440.1 Orn/Lys/Arg decarboxylase N-termina